MNWLIKLLGGYTAEEFDHTLEACQMFCPYFI